MDTRKDKALRWRHNGHDSVSNHQPRDCFLNRLLRRRSKKTSKLRVTGLCAMNSPEAGEFSAQMTSYSENVSIWWRHHCTCIPTIITIWTTEMGNTDLNECNCFNGISRSLVISWFQISSQIIFVLGTKILPLNIFLIADCNSLMIVINCILLQISMNPLAIVSRFPDFLWKPTHYFLPTFHIDFF